MMSCSICLEPERFACLRSSSKALRSGNIDVGREAQDTTIVSSLEPATGCFEGSRFSSSVFRDDFKRYSPLATAAIAFQVLWNFADKASSSSPLASYSSANWRVPPFCYRNARKEARQKP